MERDEWQVMSVANDPRSRPQQSGQQRTWIATASAPAHPAVVLEVLTDPEACARWGPFAFDVDGLATRRLAAGTRARVSGKLAGRRVGFDVEVHIADETGLALTADGPIGIDVDYRLEAVPGGSEVRASISLRATRGLAGRLLVEAAGALLRAGALEHAVSRIASEAATTAMAADGRMTSR